MSALPLMVLLAISGQWGPSVHVGLPSSIGKASAPMTNAVDFGSGLNPVTSSDCSGPLTLAASRGANPTHTRSDTSLCCPLSDASCCWVAVDQPCIQGPTATGGAGIRIDGAGVNLLYYSELLVEETSAKTPWAVDGNVGSPTLSVVSATNPVGADNVFRVAFPAVTTDEYSRIYQAVPGIGGPHTAAIWIRAATTSCNVYLTIFNAVMGIPAAATRLNATSTWQRVSASVDMGVAPQVGGISIGPVMTSWSPQEGPQGACTVDLVGATFVPGRNLRPYRETGATTYTGSADTATLVTIETSADITSSDWAISVRAQTYWDYNLDASIFMWSSGAWGTANTIGIYNHVPGPALMTVTFDADAARRDWTRGLVTNGSAHTFLVSPSGSSGASAINLSVDGVPQVITPDTETGTGVLGAVPTTLTLGSLNIAEYQLAGVVSRAAICKKAKGCR